ncbi:MAG: cytidine deaminase [Candidatus Woesearchaeota archaeon]
MIRKLRKEEICGNIERLLEEASNAMIDAYCPYSNFRVGAAILTSKGNIYRGANIENLAYGSTICAERSAICNANAHGERDYALVAIIAKNGPSSTIEPVAPCGACRQMLYEFAQLSKRDTQIIMSNTRMTKVVVASINELFPLGFGSTEFSRL